MAWYLLASHRVPVGADQSVVGLMARHILQGEHPVFYWGVPYAGSLEPHYVAVLFALFGSSMRVYHLGMAVLVTAVMAGTAAWTARVFGIPAALVALGYYAVPPFFFLYKGLTSDGAYNAVAILSLAQIAIAWSADSRRRRGRPFAWHLFALGGVSGAAFWVMPHTAALSAAIAAWTGLRARIHRRPAGILALLAGAIAGSFPWWFWNLRHGWASLRAPEIGAVSPAGALDNLLQLGLGSLPALEGGMAASPSPEFFRETFPGLRVVAILLVLVFVAVAIRRAAAGSAADQLLVAGLGSIFVAASFSARLLPYEPRYLYAYYVLFPPLVGASLAPLLRRKRGRLLFTTGVGLVLTIHALGIRGARVRDANVDRDVAGDLGPLIAHLTASGLDRVYANYWTAYRLAFESGERIIASPLPQDQTTRYAPFLNKVNAALNPAFVLLEPRDSCFASYLRERGLAFHRSTVGRFGVYSDLPAQELTSIRANQALPLPDEAYRVAWVRVPAFRSLEAGRSRAAQVGYRNVGPCIWPISVHVGYHWRPVDSKLPAVFENPRGFPPGPLEPGSGATVDFPLAAPVLPGRYELQLDLVHEGVVWFSAMGARTFEKTLTVDPPAGRP